MATKAEDFADDAIYVAIIHGKLPAISIFYEEGRRAHEAGLAFHESPYKCFSCEGLSWRLGWNDRALEQRP
jgi:hypothetical protein